MQITVKFQGIIADLLDRKLQQIDLPDGATVADLLAALTEDDEHAQAVLKQTRAFVDGKQADRIAPLADGAEVIFMRPIAGGSGRGWQGGRVSGCQDDWVGMSLGVVDNPSLYRAIDHSPHHPITPSPDHPVTPTPCHPVTLVHPHYFDAVEPGGRLRPPVCGSGSAPGA
jgi:molybdopterin converting factor small subunit